MIKSRQDILDKAVETYTAVYEKAADRYENNLQYTIVDTVGYNCTLIEELFRPLWAIAPVINENDFRININGTSRSICDYINKIMLEGTDSKNDRCFDKDVTEKNELVFANQSITEFAAYMVAVALARETLWDRLSEQEQEQIAQWILKWASYALKYSWQNNHYWYPVFCIEILKQLGYSAPENEEYLQKAYDFLESFYVGNGWYSDGDFGRFDYYQAWAHHAYTLLWTVVIGNKDPRHHEKCEVYKRRSEEFLHFFAHWFDSDGGYAAFGRSLSYRFAAVSAFGLGAVAGCDIDLGQARNIIQKNINYFYEKSIPTEDGRFPCGFLYSTPRFAESYASEGANCCYFEGFMCLMADETHPLWNADTAPMPIEQGDYIVECPVPKFDILVQGEDEYGGVTIFNNSVHYYQDKPFMHLFNDMAGYYSKFAYNSRAGFALSTRDRTSFDSMISLFTSDGRMGSHRTEIHTLYSDETMLVSRHTPFSNDEDTYITSYTIPLSGGYHVRIHKVKLSRKYVVKEGGFPVSIFDDNAAFSDNRIIYGDTASGIETISDAPVTYAFTDIHPGMHLLSPTGAYPSYATKELEPGEYIFASTVLFSTTGKLGQKPEIYIDGHMIQVLQGDKNIRINIDKEH